jgi:Kef-type K+ transport system membrane component KefB
LTDELRALFVILFVAALAPLLVDLPKRIRVPIVVAEITFGILIGPEVFGFAEPDGVVDFLSDVGLTFLFFLAGLVVDFDRIRGRPARLGASGWVLSAAIAITIAGVLQATGFVISELLVGVALCTTAIGTLMPILRDAGELETRLGPHILAAGVVGEFGPLMLMALLLTSGSRPAVTVVLLIAFVVVSLAAAFIALRARPPRVIRTIRRTMSTSGQLALRLSLVVLFGLVFLAGEFGFDIVLGAFAAGLVIGLVTKGEEAEELRVKFEGIGFGFLIPIFFVVTGMKLDLDALFSSVGTVLRLPLFLALFLVVRGLPVFVLYRKAIPPSDRLPLAFYSATALPVVVAITTIGLETDRMKPENAAALVGAAMASVLIFPLAALSLRRRSTESSAPVPVGEPG